MTFSETLLALGFATYDDYLNGEHWSEFKREYRASALPQKCLVCNFGVVDLHHIIYERVGQEKLTDVVPLCRPHHDAVHLWLKERSRQVKDTPLAVEFLKGGADTEDRRVLKFEQQKVRIS